MARNSSLRRNKQFDTQKEEFLKPQSRVDANRWLEKFTFGAATAHTDIAASTKSNIVSLNNEVDDAVRLMNIGYSAYVDEQLAAEPTYPLDLIYSHPRGFECFGAPTGFSGATNPFYTHWFIGEALHGPARARMKLLYVLSQIIVCSQTVSTNQDYVRYINILLNATKSGQGNTYRRLLKEVTYCAAMGNWLTYRNNKKENTVNKVRPDENYAREIMQLFSCGLDCLNDDGTIMTDADGHSIPTYRPDYVSEAAKFFTGFVHHADISLGSARFDHMFSDGFNHETASKKAITFPDGSQAIMPAQVYARSFIEDFENPNGYSVAVIDANNFSVTFTNDSLGLQRTHFQGSSVRYKTSKEGPWIVVNQTTKDRTTKTITFHQNNHGLTNGQIIYSKSVVEESIDFFLDNLLAHPTTAVYMSKSLIKLLVTNNPTPGYVERITRVFRDNGSGVFGDLAAVFKAIVTDRECIVPYGKNPNNHGRVMNFFERFMKLASNLRQDTVHSANDGCSAVNHLRGDTWGSPNRTISTENQSIDRVFSKPRFPQEYNGVVPRRMTGMQMPFTSPSVFNFYRPGFVPPRTRIAELGLVAPELQATSMETQTLWTHNVMHATSYHDLVHVNNENPFISGTSTWPGYAGQSVVAMESRAGRQHFNGLNFRRSTITVTEAGVSTNTQYGSTSFKGSVDLDFAIPVTGQWAVSAYHRRLGSHIHLSVASRPNQSGNVVLTFSTMNGYGININYTNTWKSFTSDNDVFQVGDVLDIAENFVTGICGFGGVAQLFDQGQVPIYHKLAQLIPNTQTVTDAEIDSAITGLEGVFLSKAISSQLRQKVVEAAKLAITLPSRTLTAAQTNADIENNYRFMIFNYSQIRIRRMIAVILVSHEYVTQY
jgi:Protein of unknown function (DUF1800)